MNTQNLGTLIKIKRQEKHLNQKQLAELLHVSATAVSKWETGINFADIQNLKSLSSILEIPLLELLGDEIPPPLQTEDFPQNENPSPESETPAPLPSLAPVRKRIRLKKVILLCSVAFLISAIGYSTSTVKTKP